MPKKLVIVESPSKAKTIKKYLGSDFEVIASQGHIIDLPKSKMGVDIDDDFKPQYITMKGKASIVKEIKKLAKDKSKVYLATDPDREGEAIAWHLKNVLGYSDDTKCRIEFNEITKNAVKSAVENVRTIDLNLVNAQQARRILDRIVGYKLSPLLWKKVRKGLSAGRVQSVALKIIIDKERQIRDFKPVEYWLLQAKLQYGKNVILANFYGDKNKKIELNNEKQVNEIISNIDKKDYIVSDIKKSEKKRNPSPPFTTSSLQQEASRKLGFTVKKTMMVAQRLYEAGYITYMRTDSVRISDEARAMAKKYIEEKYGDKYYFNRYFKTKETAQDAHEAIRPTHIEKSFDINELPKDEQKLYSLIVNRFLASQMAVAVYDTTRVKFNVNDYIFVANGSIVKFDGFMRVYTESKDDKDKSTLNNKKLDDDETYEVENTLPDFNVGDVLKQKSLNKEQKFTEPPSRYTEASLVKTLEEKGIGRPSTYAPTISTIEERTYVEREKKYLIPTELGEIVNELMENNFANIVDEKFTAEMENKLDMVAENKENYVEMLHEFYTPFEKSLEEAQEKIEKIKIPEKVTDIKCELCGRNMVIKQGRFGKFLACPGYPECKNAKPLVQTIDIPCPKCGGKILVKKTKKKRTFYVCENNTNDENSKCDYISWNKPKSENDDSRLKRKKSTTSKSKK